MEARWRVFGLIRLLTDEGMEDPPGLTCCKSSLFLRICYSARVDIAVRVRVGIQRSLPFGGLWTGRRGFSRSALEPGQRPGHFLMTVNAREWWRESRIKDEASGLRAGDLT